MYIYIYIHTYTYTHMCPLLESAAPLQPIRAARRRRTKTPGPMIVRTSICPWGVPPSNQRTCLGLPQRYPSLTLQIGHRLSLCTSRV